MPFDYSVFSVDGNTREVSYSLVGTCKLVEERSLAAVLISDKGEGELCVLRKFLSASLGMILAAFSESGVGYFRASCRLLLFLFGLFISLDLNRIHYDLLGFLKSQSQFISVYSYFHRVSHGSEFDNRNICLRDDSHVKQMLSYGSFAIYFPYDGLLAYCEIL